MDASVVFWGMLSISLLLSIIFVLTHLRPLTQQEIIALAAKRRHKAIQAYFTFDHIELTVDKAFKQSMDSRGRFYKIDESLSQAPSLIAALLKYKKHEWIVFAFEKDGKVKLLWLNKGESAQVYPSLPIEDIVKVARAENYTSVLAFHNHPNSNPKYYNRTKPSDMDKISEQYWSKVLNRCGINHVAFICERGRHYLYCLSPSYAFMPQIKFEEAIEKVNGQSRFKNFVLHFERYFM